MTTVDDGGPSMSRHHDWGPDAALDHYERQDAANGGRAMTQNPTTDEARAALYLTWRSGGDIGPKVDALIAAVRAEHSCANHDETLDVERLASMSDFWPDTDAHRWCDEDSGGIHRFDADAWARDFAAEYARLEAADKP